MFDRLVAPSATPLALELSEWELLADLDPGWLAWHVVVPAELTTAA